MNTFLRCLGALCAVAALALSLYMAGLAMREAIMRHQLQPDSVVPLTDRLCRDIPGCLGMSIEPAYDWTRGNMAITYHVRVSADGAKRNEIDNTLKQVTGAQTGLLGWALHSSRGTLDVATAPIPRKPK